MGSGRYRDLPCFKIEFLRFRFIFAVEVTFCQSPVIPVENVQCQAIAVMGIFYVLSLDQGFNSLLITNAFRMLLWFDLQAKNIILQVLTTSYMKHHIDCYIMTFLFLVAVTAFRATRAIIIKYLG